MFRKVSLESLMKWIFLLIALSMVMLILGTRLHQSYLAKRGDAVAAAQSAERLNGAYEFNYPFEVIRDMLGPFWRLSEKGEKPSFVITSAGQSYGFSLDKAKIFTDMAEEERYLILVGMLGLIIAVELAVFFSYVMTRPLRRLTWMCREITGGKTVRIPQTDFSPSEFYELIESFNNMSSELERWREIQRQLSRMDRLAALGEMLSGLSHEIKNPLASLRIQTDLLHDEIERLGSNSEETGALDEAREQITVIGDELDRLNKIIVRLLSFIRPKPVLVSPVELSTLLPWALAMLGSHAHKFGVRLELSEEARNVTVMADAEQLRQLVMNLGLNAIQAMTQNNSTRERLLTVSVGRAKGASGAEKGFITVSDTGPGVPREIEHRIFDPFFTTRKEGTGLGLSIVQQIVEGLGGELSLESGGSGTTFKVFFELQEDCNEHMDS